MALSPELGQFDRVLVSWGALCWLPDMDRWGQIVTKLLKPGGWLALADAHPAASVFDDSAASAEGMPGWYAPYLGREALPWRLFRLLIERRPGWWEWPEREWLPLSYSLRARRPLNTA